MPSELSLDNQMLAVEALARSFDKITTHNQHARVLLVGTAWAFCDLAVEQLIQEHKHKCWPVPFIRACARARSVM